jgi:nicotinamidase-related amidase
MGIGLSLDPKRSAVLAMDLQAGVVSVYVKDEQFVHRVAGLIDEARRAGLMIVHVKVGFRPGVPEASPRNVFVSAVKGSPKHQQFFQGDTGAIHPAFAPEATEHRRHQNACECIRGNRSRSSPARSRY